MKSCNSCHGNLLILAVCITYTSDLFVGVVTQDTNKLEIFLHILLTVFSIKLLL